MPKNDYHVIACYILSYLYMCLKEAKTPEEEYLGLLRYPAEIPESYKEYIYVHLEEAGYMTGLLCGNISALQRAKQPIPRSYKDAQITPKGIDYLMNDTSMEKVWQNVKDVGGLLFSMISAVR
jgi:hypothetical protein